MSASPAAQHGEGPWADLGNRVLRGVAHTLSNRAHAILAITAALDDAASPLVPLLRDESARLDGAVRLLRLLARGDRYPEPMRPDDLLADACALHAQIADAGSPPVALTIADDAPPVRVDPVASLHALLVVLDGASAAGTHPLRVAAARDGRHLRLDVARHDGAPTDDPNQMLLTDDALDLASRLLAADDGTMQRTGSVVTIRLPALGSDR